MACLRRSQYESLYAVLGVGRLRIVALCGPSGTRCGPPETNPCASTAARRCPYLSVCWRKDRRLNKKSRGADGPMGRERPAVLARELGLALASMIRPTQLRRSSSKIRSFKAPGRYAIRRSRSTWRPGSPIHARDSAGHSWLEQGLCFVLELQLRVELELTNSAAAAQHLTFFKSNRNVSFLRRKDSGPARVLGNQHNHLDQHEHRA